MSDVNLKQLQNNLRITGSLKEMNLERKRTKKGEDAIMGHIVIASKIDDKLNEFRVEMFAKKTGKLYKSYNTIINEYQPAVAEGGKGVGLAAATRLTIEGNIDINDYISQDEMKTFNRFRGVFVRRVEDETVKDEAILQVELVVQNTLPHADKEGIENGEYKLQGFTVGYEQAIVPLFNMVVGTDLADVITEHYEPGSTGKLTFAVKSYQETEQAEEDPLADAAGFGVQVDLDNTVTTYVNELRVIGGLPPYLDGKELTEEEIAKAIQLRNLKLNEVKNSAAATPPVQQEAGGFGVNASTTDTGIDISDDDLPF